MSARKSPPPAASQPPVILFPLDGCQPEGTYTKEQVEVMLKQLRQRIREHRTNSGVKAVIAFQEIRAARASGDAIRREASDWDRGYAAGQAELLFLLRGVLNSTEEET